MDSSKLNCTENTRHELACEINLFWKLKITKFNRIDAKTAVAWKMF